MSLVCVVWSFVLFVNIFDPSFYPLKKKKKKKKKKEKKEKKLLGSAFFHSLLVIAMQRVLRLLVCERKEVEEGI